MGKQNPTRPELAEKRRKLVSELPFTSPAESGNRIVVCVQDRKLSKFERVVADLDLEIVEREDAGHSMQGRRQRMVLEAS